MGKVQILMSTYNGERYLEQQLDSILKQTYSELELLVRDDGSTDGTMKILKRYAQEHENVTLCGGENIGVIQSFFELLRMSDEDAEFYGFADQDDDWFPEKIEKAVQMLEERQVKLPLLYCSDTYIADEFLQILKKDNKSPRPSWGNALVQNICTGCTAVINKPLRDIVRNTKPQNILMHDWWLYLTAELYGEVVYDNHAYIRYRQHGDNVYGAKTSKIAVWKYRLGQLKEKRGELYLQLREVRKWYDDMGEDKMRMIDSVLSTEKSFWNKVRLGFDKKIYRNAIVDDLVYRGIVLIGKL